MSDEQWFRRSSTLRRGLISWSIRVLYTNKRICADPPKPVPLVGLGLGRRPRGEGDLAFPHDKLQSRLHARLERRSRSLWVRDELSRNGTFVDGERVHGSMEVKSGGVIRLGDTFLLARKIQGRLKDAPNVRLQGISPQLCTIRRMIATVGPSPATVLVVGETGTGKNLCAHAIHEASAVSGRLVQVNCAAVPEHMAESAFFGHHANAHVNGGYRANGTVSAEGFFQSAHQGTLFLDEIGEMPLMVQDRLLTVLDEGSVTPVGAKEPISCAVRVIAATSVDLEQASAEGIFRRALFDRLREVEVHLPPLRDRREDLLLLLQRRLGPQCAPMTPALVQALLMYDWPFNVREVERLATELQIRGAGRALLDVDLILDRLTPFSAEKTWTATAADDL